MFPLPSAWGITDAINRNQLEKSSISVVIRGLANPVKDKTYLSVTTKIKMDTLRHSLKVSMIREQDIVIIWFPQDYNLWHQDNTIFFPLDIILVPSRYHMAASSEQLAFKHAQNVRWSCACARYHPSSGSLLSIRAFCSIQWSWYCSVKVLIRLRECSVLLN